jgi:hypothetical protein
LQPLVNTPPLQDIPHPLPSFTISLNTSWLNQLQTSSDPALIPFLTASYDTDLAQNKMFDIITFVIDQTAITQQFTVVLINQIRYAVRIVLVISETNEIYEALVSYTYKNGDASTAEM